MKKRILLTGATGTMGMATLRELAARPDRFEITILARPGKRNRRKLAHCGALPGVDVVWGDLTSKADVERAVGARTSCCTWAGWSRPQPTGILSRHGASTRSR